MTNEQLRKIINYLIQIKFSFNYTDAIEMLINKIDKVQDLESLLSELLDYKEKDEPMKVRGL